MDQRQKILIVDDSEIDRSLLSDMLSGQYDILEAENGLKASALLRDHEQEIALMLLDMVMPVMDGFETLEMMGRNGWIKSIPVIMITAEAVPAYVDRAYNLGALDCITQPFDERTVRHRVEGTIMLTGKQKELSHMLAEQIYEREKSNRLMIDILSNLVEFRNGESGLHVRHIQAITKLFLDHLDRTGRYQVSPRERSLICMAAALHDIGKIAVPTAILNKPGDLTEAEQRIMRTHAEEGAKLLGRISGGAGEPLIQYACQICRWHHERYDGGGYPDGLVGDQIPMAAQVVALADVYDALISRRVYKPAYSHTRAVQMILDGACGAFNPVLLECLRELSDKLRGEMKSISQGGPSRESILESVDQMARSQDLNITERTLRLLERERLKYQFLADMSPDIVFEYTAQPEMITISEGSAAMLDMPTTLFRPSEIPREKRMFSPEDFKSLIEDLRHTVPELPVIERKYQLTIKGERRWCKVIARSMWSSQGGIRFEGAMGKIIDVHDETETIKSLTEQAERDPLTGLLNQSSIRRRVSSLLSQNSGRCYALVMFDLDNFKQTNDRYGHLFGNDVLRFVAEAVRRSIREEDLAARVGGDEFVVFLEYHSRPEALVRRLFDNLTGQEHQGLRFQVSMGAALAPDAGGDYERLFHHADMAMYAAKFGGKNQYRFYEDGMEVMERD